jgi:hypothetical protein
MGRFLTYVGILGVAAGITVAGAGANGQSPAQLQRAGWSCLNPEGAFPANPNVHCFPPGQLEAVVAGTAVGAMLKAFATADVNAEEAPFLGTERMLRADHFNGQPCPTDPPGAPSGESRKNSPEYDWSYLGPRFGWDYYICHTFDSPW